MCASLLGRIARYGVSPDRNPRENRLTGICAALFDSPHCEGLAHDVALGWLVRAAEQTQLPNLETMRTIRDLLANPQLSWSCLTQTQLRLATDDGPRQLDLELRFTGEGPDGDTKRVVLWIEVKHGTKPHTQQLGAYVKGQAEPGLPHAAVLLLAPREQIPTFEDGEIPDEVPRLTWEDTAERVKRYRQRNAIDGFLVGELRAYLREEGLMDPDQLTPVHLVALANHREAVRALDQLCHIADEEVIRQWNARDKDSHGWYPKSRPTLSWWVYPGHSRESDSHSNDELWWCEWQYMRDAAEHFADGRPGVPCFVAGMTAEASSANEVLPLAESTRERVEQAGFEIAQTSSGPDSWHHVWLHAYPEDVVAGPDLRRQGHALAGWIVDAFTVLRKALDEGA